MYNLLFQPTVCNFLILLIFNTSFLWCKFLRILRNSTSETFTKAQTIDVQVSCEKAILYRKNTKPQKQVYVMGHKTDELYILLHKTK